MFFEDIYLPRPSDYDRKGKLSYEAIFQILETAASNHSTNAGDSIADANKNGIAWILTEWRVKIHHIPENGQQLNIKTWVRGKAPASMLYRDFEVVDDSDNTLLTAEAKFALLDLNTMRITRISEELFAAYCPEDKIVFEGTSRLRAPSEFSAQYDLALRRSDIDFNRIPWYAFTWSNIYWTFVTWPDLCRCVLSRTTCGWLYCSRIVCSRGYQRRSYILWRTIDRLFLNGSACCR